MTSKAQIEQMAAHVARVCKIEDIELVIKPNASGRAWRKVRRIRISPVKSAVTYAVALHEIGHLLGPRQSGLRLEQEVGAWEWAQANAVEWTPAMCTTLRRALSSYIARAASSRNWKKPEPSHPIFAMIAGHCAASTTVTSD
jgi:hypothetical protein